MKTKHYTLTKEGEDTTPTGHENVRSHSHNIGGGMMDKQHSIEAGLDKQYSDVGAGIGVIEGQSVNPGAIGGQAINPKPDEETATIGDDNLGAGTSVLGSTYPYPPNPDPNMGVSAGGETIMPKLQVQGPPQDSYGVRNTMSATGNFGAVADNQLGSVVERVTNAIMAEIGQSDPTGLGEESGPLPIKHRTEE